METINFPKDLDYVRDLAIEIVDSLVEEGIVRNCMDTDDEDEFITQDIIVDILCRKFGISNDDADEWVREM
jgi:hypothetical protein